MGESFLGFLIWEKAFLASSFGRYMNKVELVIDSGFEDGVSGCRDIGFYVCGVLLK